MQKEKFKEFVKIHPDLVDYVTSKKITWQELFEIYDLYGEDNDIWNNFIKKERNKDTTSLKDFLSLFKNIDLKSVQKTLNSISKAIDVFKTDNISNDINIDTRNKYFED